MSAHGRGAERVSLPAGEKRVAFFGLVASWGQCGTGKTTEIQNLRRGRRNKSSVGLFLGRSASFKTSHIKRDRGNECPAPLRDKPTSNKARQNAKAAGGKNPLLLCSAARIPLRRRRCPSALASSPRSSYYARSCGGASCRVVDHGCRRPGGPDGGVSCGGHPLARACGASG